MADQMSSVQIRRGATRFINPKTATVAYVHSVKCPGFKGHGTVGVKVLEKKKRKR